MFILSMFVGLLASKPMSLWVGKKNGGNLYKGPMTMDIVPCARWKM